MTTGVAFFKWTDQGVQDYRETVSRLGENVRVADKFGVEVKQVFWTPGGPYDLVGIAEGPDAESLAAFVLAIESTGYLRAEFALGYGPDEMQQLVAAAG